MLPQPTPSRLSPDFLQILLAMEPPRQFAKNIPLFQRGAAAHGVYVVVSGEVRVQLPTGPRQKQLLEIAGPGTVLGLSESMSGKSTASPPRRVTARQPYSFRARNSLNF